MRFFAPQGRHVAPMGWNLARRLRAKFHPIGATTGVQAPKTEIFTRIWPKCGIQTPRRVVSLARFLQNLQGLYPFQDALDVKIWLDLLEGYGVMGVLSWGCLVSPKFSVPPSGETMRQTPKSFGGARTCSRSSITMPSLVGLGFHPPTGRQKRWVFCLSVCSSRFSTSEVVRPISPWRRWSTETILMTLDKGRGRYVVLVVHQCSNFSDCSQLATLLNAEFQKRQKLGFFAARGRQNKPISRRNFTRKRIPGLL